MITKKVLGLALIGGMMASMNLQAQQKRCSTVEYLEQKFEAHPELREQRAQVKEKLQNLVDNKSFKTNADGNLVIPVVIHIVYATNGQNLPESRINSQMQTLNNDYNMLNEDVDLVPAEFQSVIGNVGIEFCLAKTDPSGNATNGVIRKETTVDGFSIGTDDIKHDSQGGSNAWDTKRYLNIWVGEINSSLLGYATPPGAATSDEDGVVINWVNFGTTNASQYNRGRTATHEVGHYFNLGHIWGDGPCFADDDVDDTPAQGQEYYNKPDYPQSSCNSNDMFMNFMDYVDDEAMFMFTEGQKVRMLAALNGERSKLLDNNLSLCSFPLDVDENNFVSQFELYPNPNSGMLNIRYEANNTQELSFYMTDLLGKKVYSEIVSDFEGNFDKQINIQHLPKGIYLVVVENDLQTKTQRLILQ